VVDGNQRFGGRAASIFRVDVNDHGDVSIALLTTQNKNQQQPTQKTMTSILRRENIEL